MDNKYNNSANIRSLLVGALYGLGLALIFSAGFLARDLLDIPSVFASSPPSSVIQANVDAEEPGYPLLNEVQSILDRFYLREQPSYTQRQYDAIRGMMSGLGDPNTYFIEPPVARSESDVLAGTYGGIGVNIQRNAAGQFIIYPFDDSPASRAGIRDGDILVAIDGMTIELSTQPDAVDQMLRGEVKEDNGVEVVILQDDEEVTLFILFDVINVPSVQWRVLEQDERIGYIQIIRFTSRTPSEIETAITELEEASINAMILDLRDNFGGLLQETVDVAGFFLDGGVILYEVRSAGEQIFRTDSDQSTDLPLVLLVNRGTASASELLAGALQDRERAILIGQTTYGKGTIQQIFQLSDQSSVHITSAEWLTPNRSRIELVGLQPDIPMIPDESGRDVEIEEAIRYLQSTLE